MILLSRKRSESGTPALRRRRSLTDAVASPHLAELTLAQLRNYRQRLTDEEDRVSYWRRLAHARIDILQAEASTDGTLSMPQLAPGPGANGSHTPRTSLASISRPQALPAPPPLEHPRSEPRR